MRALAPEDILGSPQGLLSNVRLSHGTTEVAPSQFSYAVVSRRIMENPVVNKVLEFFSIGSGNSSVLVMAGGLTGVYVAPLIPDVKAWLTEADV